MEYLLTGKQMRDADRYTTESIGIPAIVLIERAALAVQREALRMTGWKQCVVFCGRGSNGADGYAAARLLLEEGRNVLTVQTGEDPAPGSAAAVEKQICEHLSGSVLRYGSAAWQQKRSGLVQGGLLVVDALCGTGFTGPLRGDVLSAVRTIRQMKQSGALILSVDMPTGVSADDGTAEEDAVPADLTVTFGARKIGQILYPGAIHCGKLVQEEIGIPRSALRLVCGKTPADSVFTMQPGDLALIPGRAPDGNKGTFGRVLLLAGSRGMAGASILCAESILRSGAGMVKIITPEENRAILQERLPEAMLHCYDTQRGDGLPVTFDQDLGWANVAAAGPGLGRDPAATAVLRTFVSAFCRRGRGVLVLDADGLRILAEDRQLQQILKSRPASCGLIMTPHLGEFAALSGISLENLLKERILQRIEEGRRVAETYRACMILKDARTLVLTPDGIFLNSQGGSGMATAGSGDVLTGILSALLHRCQNIYQAACMAVLLHAAAGDLAARELGPDGMTAGDITQRVGRVLQEYTSAQRADEAAMT